MNENIGREIAKDMIAATPTVRLEDVLAAVDAALVAQPLIVADNAKRAARAEYRIAQYRTV